MSLVFPLSGRQSRLRCIFDFFSPLFLSFTLPSSGSSRRGSAGTQPSPGKPFPALSTHRLLPVLGGLQETPHITGLSIPVLPVLPGGGTYTLEEMHVLGLSLVVFAGGIFLGTIQELPDSDTIGCDYVAARGKQWNYFVINTHVATSAQDPSHVLPKAETTCECGALRT